jgi:hypothetical protein
VKTWRKVSFFTAKVLPHVCIWESNRGTIKKAENVRRLKEMRMLKGIKVNSNY